MYDRRNKRKWALVAALLCCRAANAQRLSDLTTPVPIPPGATLVIGFLGGFEPWNDAHRSIRQLVLRLRHRPGVYAESIENHRRRIALDLIRSALDTNRNGRLDPGERATARVILLGQSWGGAAALATARDLEQLGVPVLLTVQVDSVGVRDEIIPANVHAAVNLFQHDPLTIQGRAQIRAADPTITSILGNYRFSYGSRSIDESNASWARRTLGGSHAKMELDPAVWKLVQQYIDEVIRRR